MPANVASMRATLDGDPRLQACVQLFPLAVTGQPHSSLTLFAEAAQHRQVVASAVSGFSANNTEEIVVECTTLTAIILRHEQARIDLLKLDCEGSEYDIIYATAPDLVRRITRMTVEVHDLDADRRNIASFAGYLTGIGYTVRWEPMQHGCYALSASIAAPARPIC